MRLYPFASTPAAPPATTTPTRASPSSLTDAEWAVLQPLVQRPATPQGGRPPKVFMPLAGRPRVDETREAPSR
jgi:hypothetical protein